MNRTRPLALPVLVAVGALLVSAAPAAADVTVSAGRLPDVAIDGVGASHVVFLGNEALGASTRYCSLPRGVSACDRLVALPSPGGDSVLRPRVFVEGQVVRVFAYRGGAAAQTGLFLWTSGDRGGSFASPVRSARSRSGMRRRAPAPACRSSTRHRKRWLRGHVARRVQLEARFGGPEPATVPNTVRRRASGAERCEPGGRPLVRSLSPLPAAVRRPLWSGL